MTRVLNLALCLCLLLSLAGCNAGLAGLFAASNSDSGDSNSPSTLSAFAVDGAEQSPATIRFQLVDADADPANITFYYQVPGGPVQQLTQLAGISNPGTFAASPGGVEHNLTWSFVDEMDLPASGSYVPNVSVWGQLDGVSSVTVGANADLSGMGNDPPTVDMIEEPVGESTGITLIRLTLADSSDDLVALRIEYEIAGSGDWQLVRPAGESSSPEFAVSGLSAPAGGVTLNFFWDTDADLPLLERDVRLRMTPRDPTLEGDATLSTVFSIDNNDESTVVLDNGLIAFDATDDSGGIALPFSIADQEQDDIRVVFQWRRPGESFPVLPTEDPDAVFAIQDDPKLRAQYHVCSERVSYMTGRPEPVDATHIRLPELGTSKLPVATPGFVQRELELLRPQAMPMELTDGWSAALLSNPVALLPIGDGLEAYAVDSPGGGWRVQRIELATGQILASLATGSGAPTAASLSPSANYLFIASLSGTTWSVEQVDVSDGSIAATISGAALSSDGIRGVAALSDFFGAATVDDTVVSLGFGYQASRALFTGLGTPTGIVADPFLPNGVLVAEYDADRVLELDTVLLTRSEVQLPTGVPGVGVSAPYFPAPRAIAIDRNGARLLVLCESGSSGRELRAIQRGNTNDLDGDNVADAFVYSMGEMGAGSGASIGVGADNLRVVPDAASSAITVLGGVEQRRTILEAPATTNVVTLGSALNPPLAAARDWRVHRAPKRFRASTSGATHTFPWDSRDLHDGGPVLFRALPFDTELGLPSETSVERVILAERGLRRTRIDVGVPDALSAPSTLDYDGDGDLDVLITDGAQSRVVLQEGPGQFAAAGIPLGVTLTNSLGVPLIYEDLDGDGDLDLIHYRNDQRVEIFRGTGPQTLDPVPEVLIIPGPLQVEPVLEAALRLVDIEGDGDLDLVVTAPTLEVPQGAELLNTILIYLQGPGGVMQPTPVAVGGGAATELVRDVAFGDVNGDGLLDILSANPGSGSFTNSGSLTIHFQDGPASFDPTPLFLGEIMTEVAMYTTSSAFGVDLADMDGDGDLDVIACHGTWVAAILGEQFPRFNRVVTIFWQVAPGVFDLEPLVLEESAAQSNLAEFFSVSAVDIDLDGDLDVVAQNAIGWMTWFNLGAGEFDPNSQLNVFEAAFDIIDFMRATSVALTPVDMDGDGDLDRVYRDLLTGEVKVAFALGAGLESFGGSPMQVDLQAGGLWDSVVADLDGDGDLDLASIASGALGNGATNELLILTQSAPRTFGTTPIALGGLPGMQYPTRVDSADMDQDGDRDLVVVSTATNDVQVYFQESPGVYGTPALFEGVEKGPVPTQNALASLELADIDGDGDVDFLTAANWFETLLGFEQVAPGSFQSAFRIDNFKPGEEVATYPRDLTTADLDGDGDLELLMVTGTQADLNTLLVFDGTGPLQYESVPTVFDNGGSITVDVADVDGDGRLDIVTTGEIGGGPDVRIILHLQRAPGVYDRVELGFVANTTVFQPTGSGLRLGDFDGDGDLDIAALLGGTTFLNGTLSVIDQIAPGVFATHPRITIPGFTAPGRSLFVEDVDGDGEVDFLLPNFVLGAGNGQLTVVWGNR